MQFPTARHLLTAGVVALAVTVASTAHAGAQTAPDPALVAQVPAAFVSTCTASTIEGAEAVITCTPPGIERVTYARFATPELADAYYDEGVGEDGRDTGSDCADVFESESPYHTATGAQGRLTCASGRRESSLTWIEGATVATATGRDEVGLYEWWDDLVGRSLTAAQQELMTNLPAGVPRELCHDNGESSVKCWPVSSDGVYGVYYTQYPDRRSMDAAYAELLADAGLRRDLRPASDKGGTCTYETYWGPLRHGEVAKKLGRLACVEKYVGFDLVWTNNDSHVITKASAFSSKDVHRFFHAHPGTASTKGANRG